MTTLMLVRRFLVDYVRNPVNIMMLVVVPIVFVVVAAQSLADMAQLLGGAGGGPAVETATAGWAAGFLAAVAMYFQIAAARDVDRRMVLAGIGSARLVSARLLAGFVLAVLAGVVALVALAVRTGIDDPVRVSAGTLMFATIYLGFGAVIGACVRNPVNGIVLILFVFIIDVFFGPTLSAYDKLVTRALPTHFVSLWMVDLPSRHGGRLGDLGLGLAWTVTAIVLAFAVVTAIVRIGGRTGRQPRAGSARDQLGAAMNLGLRVWRRNPVLWILLVIVPAVFVLLSEVVTPHRDVVLDVTENGRSAQQVVDIATLHSGTMAPIAVASLATVAGLFMVLDSRAADARLALAGLRAWVLLAARLAVLALAVGVATAVSLVVTATVFAPVQWILFIIANTIIGLTYGLVGVLIGPAFGRVAGVFVAFTIPFLDVGMSQSPMLRGQPPDWAHYLPGYGGMRLLMDAAVTDTFDETRALVIALGWLIALAMAAGLVFRGILPRPRETRLQRTLVSSSP